MKLQKSEALVPSFEITDANNFDVLKKLCNFLSEKDVISSGSLPVPTCYPHFVGVEKASIRAAVLDEFIAAKVVMVSPGVAVLRDTVLSQGKMLVSPAPGLRDDKVLQELVVNKQEIVEGKRHQKFQRKELNEETKIDVLVVGSMLVDKTGRRMGKKLEQVGVEYVLGKLFTQSLVVITIVHDCQVVEHIPESMFSAMDVPVDIIVTPSKVIRVKDRLPKPKEILWNKVTENMLHNIPALKAAWVKDKEIGKNVELAPAGLGGWNKGNNMKSGKGDKVMGSKIKLMSLPKELKYSELRDALRRKVEPGFKIGVLKFGLAVVYFKERPDVVKEKLTGLEVEGKVVDIEELEFVKEPKLVKVEPKKGCTEEVKVKKGKVEMKSKFKIENIGIDTKSVEMKKALIACGLHFGYLKIFRRSNMAIVLFKESGDEVKKKIQGLIIGDQKVVMEEVELGEKKRERAPLKEEVKKSRKEDKLERLKEMKSKFKFQNLGHVKVAKLKESLRKCKVEPGFMVVHRKFGNAIVLFKEDPSEIEKKLKNFKVDETKVEFKDVELVQQRITRSKSLSEGDKYEKPSTGYRRKRSASQKFYESGLTGIFIGSLPRGATAKEVKEAVVKKEVNAAHVELIGRKRIAFAYFDKPESEYDVLLDKLKGLKVKEHACKVEVMRSPPRNSRPPPKDATKSPRTTGVVAKEADLTTVNKVSSTSSIGELKRSKKISLSDDEKKTNCKKSAVSADFEKIVSKGIVTDVKEPQVKKRQVKTSRGST